MIINILNKTKSKWVVMLIIIGLYKLYKKRMSIIRKRRKQRTSNTASNNKHRIVFGGCGNLMHYQMGVMKAIFEFVDSKQFHKCDFEGISGGAATAGYSCAVMYGCHDIDFWEENGLLKVVDAASTKPFGMLWTAGNSIIDAGNHYVEQCFKWNNNVAPKWVTNNQWSVWITCANMLSDDFLINKQCPQNETADFSKQQIASSFIPFIISPHLYYKLGHVKCIDGGIAQLFGDYTIFNSKNAKNENCKILYVNTDFPTKRRVETRKIPNGNIIYYLDIWKWDKFGWKDVMIWGDVAISRELYDKGYHNAKQHMDEIQMILKKFLN